MLTANIRIDLINFFWGFTLIYEENVCEVEREKENEKKKMWKNRFEFNEFDAYRKEKGKQQTPMNRFAHDEIAMQYNCII